MISRQRTTTHKNEQGTITNMIQRQQTNTHETEKGTTTNDIEAMDDDAWMKKEPLRMIARQWTTTHEN